jgi:hypothetical protein
MTRTVRNLALAAALMLIPASVQAQGSLSADDMAEIHNLYAQYNLMLDGGDAEGWADTFVEDGRFGTSVGRAALIEFAENFHESNPASRHWNTNTRITPTVEGAAGTTYLMLWNVGVRPATITVTGIYTDVLVRTADGWRFQSRQVAVDR